MQRRKFIYYFTTGIFLFGTSTFLSNCKNKRFSFDINNKQKSIIEKYNNARITNLKNNFDSEVKKDLWNNKTIWVEKKLYTYAEIYKN